MTGYFFAKRTLLAAVLALTVGLPAGAHAAGGDTEPLIRPEGGWSFEGFLGRFEQDSLQRGYQVYREVCAACHSMDLLSYRNLSQPGGPEFDEDVVERMAAEAQVLAEPDEEGNTVDEFGSPLRRPGRPSDAFVAPYVNEAQARNANGGALPPDLSVIAKARHGTVDYLYSLLLGYKEPPADVEMRAGMYYNIYFPGRQIAMARQLQDGLVEYEDGTEATKEQMAYDLTQFMKWAAEPTLEQRKSMGVTVMLYLTGLAILLYLAYRRVWSDVKH